MPKMTTIPLSMKTRDRLKDLGKKGETYDTIVKRVLDEREKGE